MKAPDNASTAPTEEIDSACENHIGLAYGKNRDNCHLGQKVAPVSEGQKPRERKAATMVNATKAANEKNSVM